MNSQEERWNVALVRMGNTLMDDAAAAAMDIDGSCSPERHVQVVAGVVQGIRNAMLDAAATPEMRQHVTDSFNAAVGL